ncbi:MAG: hypothetical protein AB2L20_10430 [Mangrovibacterium sp.]
MSETTQACVYIEKAIAALMALDPSGANSLTKIRYQEASAAKEYWQLIGQKLPSLVSDLMEPLRPVTDRILIEAVLAEKSDNCTEMDEEEKICRVSKPGRKKPSTLFTGKLHTKSIYKKLSKTLNNHILFIDRHEHDRTVPTFWECCCSILNLMNKDYL